MPWDVAMGKVSFHFFVAVIVLVFVLFLDMTPKAQGTKAKIS
jgi:hypothetical protein